MLAIGGKARAPEVVQTRIHIESTPKVIETPILKDSQLAKIDGQIARLEKVAERLRTSVSLPVDALLAQLTHLVGVVKAVRQPQLPLAATRNTHAHRATGDGRRALPAQQSSSARRLPIIGHRPDSGDAPHGRSGSSSAEGSLPAGSVDITPARQKILNALAFFEGVGIASVDKTQLALMAGVPPTSGGYKNNLGALRSDGLIDYPTPGTVAPTDRGRAIASVDGIPQTTEELQAALREKLPSAKWKILDALIRAYPNAMDKEQLADACEVPSSSGGYKNNLGSLRSLGLLDYPQPGLVQAQPVLFLEGR